jgi:hypothetical protein
MRSTEISADTIIKLMRKQQIATLLATAAALVEAGPAGYFVGELDNVMHVSMNGRAIWAPSGAEIC